MGAFEEAVARRNKRYEEIKHLDKEFEWTRTPGYAHFRYTAKTTHPEAMQLSSQDVMLLADHGNLCFGGECGGYNGNFSGKVYTD